MVIWTSRRVEQNSQGYYDAQRAAAVIAESHPALTVAWIVVGGDSGQWVVRRG